MKKYFTLFLLLSYIETNAQIKVTGISVSPAAAVIVAGTKLKINATIFPYNATDKKYTWSTSDASVATVDSAGNVTGIQVGNCDITVTTNDGGITDHCLISVVVHVSGITVSPDTVSVFTTKDTILTATIAPINATDKTFTWTSSDPAIATVDTGGKVTGIKEGTCMIKVKTTDGDKTDSCFVTVISNIVSKEIASVQTLDIYPNPAGSHVQISFGAATEGLTKINIINLSGITVLSRVVPATAGNNTVILSLEDLTEGVYFISVINNGIIQTGHLIIAR